MSDFKLIVFCERIPRRAWYYTKFIYNEELKDKIKSLDQTNRKWNASKVCWEVSVSGLIELIKSFKGSEYIHFDFGTIDSRKLFVDLFKKHEKAENDKVNLLKELNEKKLKWDKYKLELETTYVNYSQRLHALIKIPITLYPHQIIAAMFMNETRSALISHEMGLGKCQPLTSKILTPNGWTNMGSIKINDFVIGSDGQPKRVLKTFPQGQKDIYEVRFNDGTSAECCDEHLWNVNTQIRNWRKNTYVTKSLREIMNEGLTYQNGNNKHYIPIVKPIEFSEKDLSIDPYVLGCLLGDGSLTTKYGIGFSSLDKEILDIISTRLPVEHNMIISGISLKDYYLTADGKNNYINQALRRYDLKECNSYTKFIPDDYKFSSISQRLEILQGILDTDGHSRPDGIIELTLASKQLIDDTQFIIQSLGGIARLHDKYVMYNGEKRKYYRLHIKLPSDFIPFKLERKILTFVTPSKYPPNKAITNIFYVGKKESQCILIDSEDHLYLTDNCILTHNTLSSILYVELNNFKKVVVVTPNSLKFNYYNEVTTFTNSKAYIVNWKKNNCTIAEAKYIIVNYDYFNPSDKAKMSKKWDKLKIGNINSVICDECFIYDTIVATSKGSMKIGDIVENKLNVKILSYNHKLKKLEYNSIERYLYNGKKRVIKIKLNNGKIIECTPNHKIYANGEYIQAKNLKHGDKLFMLSEVVCEEKKRTKILFETLFATIFKYIGRKKKICGKSARKTFNERGYYESCGKNLLNMWRSIYDKGLISKKVLFNKLFGKMAYGTIRDTRKSIYERIWGKNRKSYIKKLQGESRTYNAIVKSDEIKQSNVYTGEFEQNDREIKRTNIFIQRWKRKINKATRIVISKCFGLNIHGNGIHNTNINAFKKYGSNSEISADTLQCGHWNTIFKISHRNRWSFAQKKTMEIFRHEKNRNIEYAWVDSVEILEFGSGQQYGECNFNNKETYNLEIANNHNYFASEILVSNCQKLKNTDSNTYKNYKKLFNEDIFIDHKPSKIYLSGTPAPNRAFELYSVLNQISPLDFATKKYFYEYYCGMVYELDGFGWKVDEDGEKRLEELYFKISPYTHRKRKAEVLTDLPDKTYQKIIFELSDADQKNYDDVEKNVANDLFTGLAQNALTTMLRLRQLTAKFKIESVVEIIENILETGEKVIIVDNFKESLYEFKKIFGNIAALHTGDQSVEERADLVKAFQDPNSEIKIFLASIQTANYGLTLTAASKMIIMTLPYSVGEYDQVADRCHRIGQKDAVNIYPTIVKDSIDEYVYDAIEGKRREITKVMDNEDYVSTTSEAVISDVINRIKNKYK
jgi:SNF2 family DNA or RNA helicase